MSGGSKERRKRRRQQAREPARLLWPEEQGRWSEFMANGYRNLLERANREILEACAVPERFTRSAENDRADVLTYAMLDALMERRRSYRLPPPEFHFDEPEHLRRPFITSPLYGIRKAYSSHAWIASETIDLGPSPGNAPTLSTPTADPGLAPTLSRACPQEIETK